MKIIITTPIPEKGYQAGVTYEISQSEAEEIIKRQMGFEPKTFEDEALCMLISRKYASRAEKRKVLNDNR